ncbi:YfhE family protein [Bacillus lacus]|uniref:YfhE family protein n=1 Tax=Metabacillus lacus TaxID=1983721 RepID=A0A7X2J211_9BACI|nr:YfhE family protein [Metabacillus lacus]MRX73905.1 YfhE family protein [Metabacillus lacus]
MAEKKRRDQARNTLSRTQEVIYQREFKAADRAFNETANQRSRH